MNFTFKIFDQTHVWPSAILVEVYKLTKLNKTTTIREFYSKPFLFICIIKDTVTVQNNLVYKIYWYVKFVNILNQRKPLLNCLNNTNTYYYSEHYVSFMILGLRKTWVQVSPKVDVSSMNLHCNWKNNKCYKHKLL